MGAHRLIRFRRAGARRAAWLILLASLTAALGPGTRLVAADGLGTISGQVTNGTTNAAPIGALEVTLHTLTHASGEETGPSSTTRTDDQGRFTFASLSTASTNGYVVTGEFGGVSYASDLLVFPPEATTAATGLTVYEPTSDLDGVRFRQQHVIVGLSAEGQTLEIVEISVLQNDGLRAYVGNETSAPAETLKLSLPAGARDVDFGGALANGAAVVPGGVAYTGPVLPGQTQLVLGYRIDYPGRAYSLKRSLPLAADAVDVLVEDRGLGVSSRDLTPPSTVEMGSKRFLRLTGRDVPAGSLFGVDLVGVLRSTSQPGPEQWLPVAAVATLATAAAFVVAARLRHASSAATRAQPAFPDDELDDEDWLEEPK